MDLNQNRIFSHSGLLLQFLILVFSGCLVWFTFVYYPNVLKGNSISLILKKPFQQKVLADSTGLPITTDNYKITYEKNTKLYYVFVEGFTVDEFVENATAAQLALKNALSVETLCNANIIYASTAGLPLAEKYKKTAGC